MEYRWQVEAVNTRYQTYPKHIIFKKLCFWSTVTKWRTLSNDWFASRVISLVDVFTTNQPTDWPTNSIEHSFFSLYVIRRFVTLITKSATASSVLISCFQLCLGIPRCLLPLDFPTKALYAFLLSTVHVPFLNCPIVLYSVFPAYCCSIHSSLLGVYVYALGPSHHIFRLKLRLSLSCPFVNVVLFSISQRHRCLLTFLGPGDFSRCPNRVPCYYCTSS